MTLYRNYIVTSIILTRTVVNQLHQQAYADGSVLLLKMSDVFYHDQVAWYPSWSLSPKIVGR